jgi:opacity protein-like surface antigen
MKTILVCLFLITSCLYAQEPLLDKTRKHELGTAVQGLFGSGGGYGLTYRRMFANSAFRFGTSLDGNRRSSDQELVNSTGTNVGEDAEENRFSIRMRFGYEGQIWLSPQWMTYLGGDILLGANNRSQTRTSLVTGTEVQNQSKSSTYSVGLAPFLGLRFQITPRVSLGTELRYVADLAFRSEESRNVSQNTITTTAESVDFSHYFSRPAGIYLQLAL